VRRLQLFEIHEQAWFPQFLRDYVTEALQILLELGNLYGPAVRRLQKTLEVTKADRVVDLCSGAGGPWLSLTDQLAGRSPLEICLTDKYPHEKASIGARRLHSRRIHFHPVPVEATQIPAGLKGFRTMFTAFHHFPPQKARAILEDAVLSRQGIGIFEASGKHVFTIFLILLLPFLYFVVVPFVRPFRWERLLWSYLIPVLPLVLLFDGIVSCLRAYSPKELREFTEGISGADYTWEIGEMTGGRMPARVTFLIGYPSPEFARRVENLSSEIASHQAVANAGG